MCILHTTQHTSLFTQKIILSIHITRYPLNINHQLTHLPRSALSPSWSHPQYNYQSLYFQSPYNLNPLTILKINFQLYFKCTTLTKSKTTFWAWILGRQPSMQQFPVYQKQLSNTSIFDAHIIQQLFMHFKYQGVGEQNKILNQSFVSHFHPVPRPLKVGISFDSSV